MVWGPSIVFIIYAWDNAPKIISRDYENVKLSKTAVEYDASFSYLHNLGSHI